MIHQPGDTAVFPKFTDEQLEWLRLYGTERLYEDLEERCPARSVDHCRNCIFYTFARYWWMS